MSEVTITLSIDEYWYLHRGLGPMHYCVCHFVDGVLRERGDLPSTDRVGWSCSCRGTESSGLGLPIGTHLADPTGTIGATVEGGKVLIGEQAFRTLNQATDYARRMIGRPLPRAVLTFWHTEYPVGSGCWRPIETFRLPHQVKRRGPRLVRVSRDNGVTWHYEWSR